MTTVRQQYRKTLIATQAFILLLCAAAFWKGAELVPGVVCLFLVMQAGAVLGAWWAVRLKRKAEISLPLGPLQNKRR